jgi:L-threonylcarbamoyladenylate synthase
MESTVDIGRAASFLREGGILAYPTETYYGLGVNAEDEAALIRLSVFKQRPQGQPFPVLLPSSQSLESFASVRLGSLKRLIDHFWPGPLTIVLPTTKLPQMLHGPSGGVGFRVSAHPIAQELLNRFGSCVTTTSANISGQPGATTARDVLAQFTNEAGLILDGGQTTGGLASTVIDLTERNEIRLIRSGAVAWEEIQKVWRT